MKNYWLYLDPYTFLFERNGHSVIYNTISNQGRKFKNTEKVKAIVNQLNDSKNMYCVEIPEADLKDSDLLDFVNYIHDTYSGDLLDSLSFPKKPVIFVPKFKINKTIEQLQETDFKLTSDDVLSYFNELSIYIGGGKPTSMLLDIPVYKQFDYNRDLGNNQLSIKDALSFISQIEYSPLGAINILGGNIFTYSELRDFAKGIEHIHAIKIFNTCYNDVPDNLTQFEFLSGEKARLKVLVDFPLNSEKLDHVISLIKSSKIQTQWLFAITSMEEFDEAELIIDVNGLDKAIIKPVYTGANLPLFISNIYLDEEDILNTRLSRNDIFVKQVLNTYDFGKLILMADGKVYANANHEPIGLHDESVVGMILKEISNKNSWRRIRDQKPCNDCVYQWLCPSPSNYELAIDKANLCSVTS